jgi:uncharacterized hydrophobic protein (TIGR00271 family)
LLGRFAVGSQESDAVCKRRCIVYIRAMVHLRIVAPAAVADRALEALEATASVCNIVVMKAAATRPAGDVILCDVPREEASVVIADLRELGVDHDGSIAVETIDTLVSDHAARAEEAAKGSPADAVVWEEVEARTSESASLSASFAAFMILAALIASVGIYVDSPILIVGAMVVGPEFGPIAGFCVAIVQPPRSLALRSFVALAVGLSVAIAAVLVASFAFKATGVAPRHFTQADHGLSQVIASPDFFSFFVALCAGAAGILSLSTAKSGALIGVLISVTTIPAAANIGVAAAYGDWPAFRGSLTQLGVNVVAILLSGTVTLALQRAVYERRRRRHVREGFKTRWPIGMRSGEPKSEPEQSPPAPAPEKPAARL